MKIAILAPSPIPFTMGGAENVYAGLFQALQRTGTHQTELIKVPVREDSFWHLISAYSKFFALNLSHFDAVISLKYPAWAIQHRCHIVYMQHKLRGLYDTYAYTGLPLTVKTDHYHARRILDYMLANQASQVSRHETIVKFMGMLFDLSRDPSVPRELTSFPGPFIRKIVHFLDSLCLAMDQVASFNAISQTVARRPQYFPDGAAIKVLFHPSGLPIQPPGDGEFFFTVSRLERAKRVDLLIDAFKRSRARQPFVIAGAGPDRGYFEKVAGGDPRIHFVGRLSDAELAIYYAKATAVLFAPYDEDFGLVALEAMGSGKPVITTTDAGGPMELIDPGKNGLIVPPTADDLMTAIGLFADNPATAREMGVAARDSVAHVTWENLTAGLLNVPLRRSLAAARPRRSIPVRPGIHPRGLVLGLSTYGGADARSGGPLRIQNLYKRMARSHDVVVIVLGRERGGHTLVAPSYTEITVAVPSDYLRAEAEISCDLDWTPVSDGAFPLLYRRATDFLAVVKEYASRASAIILEQPYLWPALSGIAGIESKLILDEHNVELILKRDIFPTHRRGRELLGVVQAVEHEACMAAQVIMACSDDDKLILQKYFGVSESKVSVVPNGVDCELVRFTGQTQRRLRKFQIGVYRDEPIGYFVGSWHGPNIDAALRIIDAARGLKEIRFVIAGTVGDALKSRMAAYPRNVTVTGRLDDDAHREMLSVCQVALNPMADGSGTNLKIFEYGAAGAPIVSTNVGIRGTALVAGEHAEVVPIAWFEEGIVSAMSIPKEALVRRTILTRRHIEAKFDWEVIFDRFTAAVGSYLV